LSKSLSEHEQKLYAALYRIQEVLARNEILVDRLHLRDG